MSLIAMSNGAGLFSGLPRRRLSLKYDRPERILGCRKVGECALFAVLFRDGFGFFSNEEVSTQAPWLLARYLVEHVERQN